MQIDILTLFPEMFENVLNTSIIGNAQSHGIVEIKTVQIRDFSSNKHNKVDDYPYGGGNGMVMEPTCIYDAVKSTKANLVCYLTPKGRTFNQNFAEFLSKQKHVAFLCGHYEGIDQRVIDEVVDLEISLGDFVLTGGEIPAMAVIDATCRLLNGVLNVEQEKAEESFYNGLLEYPQYTRPEEWNDKKVPEILLSGHHKNIEKWRHNQSVFITDKKRPDLLDKKRVGVFCAEFNPVTLRDIEFAKQAQKLYNIDKIVFAPENNADYNQLAMLQIAINDIANFELMTDNITIFKENHKNDDLIFITDDKVPLESEKLDEKVKKYIKKNNLYITR